MTEATAKLLLVDDNANNLRVLERGFAVEKYELHMARDGAAALELARALLPDLILLDINMPGMSGLDVCKALKAAPETADIPVIFLSARDQSYDKVRGLEVGGVDYIIKPFDFAEVSARVKVHLTMRRQQQQIIRRQQHDLESLERLNEMRTEIMRRLIHDVQSPVSNILLSVDMLRRQGLIMGGRGSELLERIVKSSHAISAMFSNVIDITKAENVPDLRLQQVVIGSFIHDVIAAVESDAEQKRITIGSAYANVTPVDTGMFDADRMTSVLLNLLSNAIKYSPEGSAITITVDSRSGMLTFSVADNGYGIPPTDLPHLFEKYYRGEQPQTDILGTGLGLYIVKMNVEQHGGRVTVESEIGRGSIFTVAIPAAAGV